MVDGYWGRAAAGILFRHRGRYLLMLRSGNVLNPFTWGVPGGKVDGDESRWEAAVREVEEETGYDASGARKKHDWTWQAPDAGFQYTTFVVDVDEPFEAVLNWESDDAAWFHPHELRDLDLHSGVVWLFQQMGVRY